MKKIFKSLFSLALALCLMLSLGTAAFADNWDIANGDISVSATESGQNVSQGTVSKADSAPVISGTSTSNTVTISAAENATANVTFDNLNISTADNTSSKAPVSVTGDGNVNIEIDNTNTLNYYDSQKTVASSHAPLEKNDDAGNGTLTITDKDGNGTLNATVSQGHSAAIGSSQGKSTSNITIEGGTINAQAESSGAAIGSGYNGSADGIHISGGTVKASAGATGAAIGSGSSGSADNIQISGDAKVEANARLGAAIGSGSEGSVGTVTISDNAQITTNNEPYTYPDYAIGDGIGAGDGGNKKNSVFDTSKLTSKGSITMNVRVSNNENDYRITGTTVIVGSYVPPVAAVAAASATQPLPARYYVIIGNNAAWAAGSAEKLAFKLNSAEVIKVLIDGEEVAFEISDSGEVVIAAEVLEALDPGTHEIEFIFADGSCETVFNII